MKLFEIITDGILDSRLFEMAFRRREVESKITSLSSPICKHLIKILKWHDVLNYNKHVGDINDWIFDIQRMYIKGNRKPTQNDYFNWMYNDVIRDELTVSRMIVGLHEYHDRPVIRTDEKVHDIIKAIMYQISYDLVLNKYDNIKNYLPAAFEEDDPGYHQKL